jgi:Domain of unknown function (DUF4476)
MKSTLLLFTLLIGSNFAFGQMNAVIYSEAGEKFTVYLNGESQNDQPKANVKIQGLTSEFFQCRIDFEDSSLPDFSNNNFACHQGMEVTYIIKKNKKGEYVLRYYTENPISSTTSVNTDNPNKQFAVADDPHYEQSQNANSSNTQNTGGNVSMNINTNGNTGGVGVNISGNDGQTGGQVGVNVSVKDGQNGGQVGMNISAKDGQNGGQVGMTISAKDGQNGGQVGMSISAGDGQNGGQVGMNISAGDGENGGNVSMNMNVDGVNFGMNMNVDGAELGTTQNMNTKVTSTTTTTNTTKINGVETTNQTTTNQTTNTGNGKVVVSGNSGCLKSMDDASFAKAVQNVSSKGFDETKLATAKQIIKANCFTSEQVKTMLSAFGFEETKLDFAKFAYDYCFDTNNYYIINDAFGFDSTIEELNEFLQTK